MTTAEVCPRARSICRRPQHRPRAAPPTLSSRARSANSGCRLSARRPVFPLRQSPTGARDEPPFQIARARSRRQAGHRRRDRRRQVRHHVPVAGAADARHARRRRRRSRRRARPQPAQDRRLAGRAICGAPRSPTRTRRAATFVTDRRRGADRRSAHRGDRRGDRRARRRHPALPVGDRQRQAHRHGQCRGRRGGRAAAGAQGEERGRRLFARLGRPAGADLRARRLGARRRLQGDLRRQGHALRAALSQVQSRQCLGHPRQISEHHRPQVDQSEDVQFLRRRHQVRHRDDGGVQRHRPRAAVGRPAISRRRRASSSPRSASRKATAARWKRRASPR